MYLKGVYTVEERIPGEARFPYNLPFVRGLDLGLDQPVTFFVGENGSGKSTLLEAIADLCGLHVGGGGSNDLLYTQHEKSSELASVLRPRFRQRPQDGYFFRAETLVNFATLLEQRDRDPDFIQWTSTTARCAPSPCRIRSITRSRGGSWRAPSGTASPTAAMIETPESAVEPLPSTPGG